MTKRPLSEDSIARHTGTHHKEENEHSSSRSVHSTPSYTILPFASCQSSCQSRLPQCQKSVCSFGKHTVPPSIKLRTKELCLPMVWAITWESSSVIIIHNDNSISNQSMAEPSKALMWVIQPRTASTEQSHRTPSVPDTQLISSKPLSTKVDSNKKVVFRISMFFFMFVKVSYAHQVSNY